MPKPLRLNLRSPRAAIKTSRVKLRREAFADLKTNEAANDNLIGQLLGDPSDVFLDGDLRVLLHETLVQQAKALEYFSNLPSTILAIACGGFPFTCSSAISFSLAIMAGST